MKLAIITSGFLPIPATKGGAVENLIVNIMNKNEEKQDFKITVFSDYDKLAEKEIKKYSHSKCIFIKSNIFVNIGDKIIFFIAKNILKKNNSHSYRFILKRLHYLWKVSKYLKINNYDKILLENHPTQYLSLKWRKNYIKYKDKYYYHCHNEIPSTYGCINIIKETNKFLCVSNFIKNKVKKSFDIENLKILVLRNGINTQKINKKMTIREKKKLKEKYKINPTTKILLYTGRIVEEKGIKELILSLNKVKYDDYKLIIVGSSINALKVKTSFEKELYKLVENVEKKVIFTGYINYDEIYKFYNIADVAIFPSIWDDPAPLTVIEALVCGLPIITTDSGGISEYATEKSAIIIKRNNKLVYNLARSIDEMLINKEKREIMKKNAKIDAKKLTIEEYYSNFVKCIK